jgi:hypothetical protein
MLRKNLAAVFVAAAIGATGVYIGTATAMPISSDLPDTVTSDPNFILIHKGPKGHKHVRDKNKRWVYSSGRHGPRYRARRMGYGYYYNGWYYQRPWWQVDPGIFICIGC